MAEATIDQGYLAKPPGDCCIAGSLHDGEPRGTYETVEGIETYFVSPPAGRSNGNIVLYFPDVWGFFKNGLLVMDGFADAGYLTIGLDYFTGDPVWKHRKDRHDTTTEPDFDYEAWKKKHQGFAAEAVPGWVDAVKAKYCFGAPYVCDQLAEGGICSAGAFAHPAFLKEHHFRNLKRTSFFTSWL
ncbi:hypothetical protein SLS64_009588 [Diaporthe eres]